VICEPSPQQPLKRRPRYEVSDMFGSSSFGCLIIRRTSIASQSHESNKVVNQASKSPLQKTFQYTVTSTNIIDNLPIWTSTASNLTATNATSPKSIDHINPFNNVSNNESPHPVSRSSQNRFRCCARKSERVGHWYVVSIFQSNNTS
jgi:hypothetical protein